MFGELAIVFALAVAFVGVLGAGVKAWTSHLSPQGSVRRAINEMKPVPIDSAVEGHHVKITGTLRLDSSPLCAPVSERPCAAYHVTFLSVAGEDARLIEHHRPPIEEEEALAVDFLIEDHTGVARVRGSVGLLALQQWTHLGARDSQAKCAAFLKRRGVRLAGAFGEGRDVQMSEAILEPGDVVTAVGIAHWEFESQSSTYRETGRRLILQPSSAFGLIVTDRDKLEDDSPHAISQHSPSSRSET